VCYVVLPHHISSSISINVNEMSSYMKARLVEEDVVLLMVDL
jgi:hypothetical protein